MKDTSENRSTTVEPTEIESEQMMESSSQVSKDLLSRFLLVAGKILCFFVAFPVAIAGLVIFFVVEVFVTGQILLLYAVYFAPKRYRLHKEYLSAGVAVDGYCSKCVSKGTNEAGDPLYDCSYQYLPPDDSSTCYEVDSSSSQQEEIGAHAEILVLPGIPASGTLQSSLSEGNRVVQCLCLLFGVVWGPSTSFYLACLAFSEEAEANAAQIFGVYVAILVLVFIPMSWLFSRRMMVQWARVVPSRKVVSTLQKEVDVNCEENKMDDDTSSEQTEIV
jgi:hypothetical protein